MKDTILFQVTIWKICIITKMISRVLGKAHPTKLILAIDACHVLFYDAVSLHTIYPTFFTYVATLRFFDEGFAPRARFYLFLMFACPCIKWWRLPGQTFIHFIFNFRKFFATHSFVPWFPTLCAKLKKWLQINPWIKFEIRILDICMHHI